MEHARWIWADCQPQSDQYAEFYDRFSFSGGKAVLSISADSNYAVYLNGQLADSGQYPDFPHCKVFDRLDLTPLCRPGENHLAIIVWYHGESTMSYYPGRAALRYGLELDGETVCRSGASTLSRLSRCYENGLKKQITSQLGFGFHYDLTREDGWMLGQPRGFAPSAVVEQELPLFPRPVEKCRIEPPVPARLVRQEGGVHFLFDLGEEQAGYLTFRVQSAVSQRLTICWGEHIVDGGVRRIIDDRDFSVQCTLREGGNVYLNPFRRLGLRYLEVFAEAPVQIEEMTVRPVCYPLRETGRAPADPLRRKIYEVSLRTLRLCIHDHYEDTPWREQALYAMDSRNQMLCGYYAFGEYRMPRACLWLMGQDRRPDGLLSICCPTASPLTIPSFSLHYFTEVHEYTLYSGDKTLARELLPRLTGLMQVFAGHMEDGLLPNWQGKNDWNFYEWSEGLDGSLGTSEEKSFDTVLNALFVLALRHMDGILQLLDEAPRYGGLADAVADAVRERLYDAAAGFFRNSSRDPRPSQLANALALLCGAVQGPEALALADRLRSDPSFTLATLSMRCFVYDALLQVDPASRDWILQDIDTRYKRMLDAGATTFWETEVGALDFDRAGSLCHAWSAMPVYYYHILEA